MCEVLAEPEGHVKCGRAEGLPYFKRLRLNFSTTYYSMAHRLGLKRLQELFQARKEYIHSLPLEAAKLSPQELCFRRKDERNWFGQTPLSSFSFVSIIVAAYAGSKHVAGTRMFQSTCLAEIIPAALKSHPILSMI